MVGRWHELEFREWHYTLHLASVMRSRPILAMLGAQKKHKDIERFSEMTLGTGAWFPEGKPVSKLEACMEVETISKAHSSSKRSGQNLFFVHPTVSSFVSAITHLLPASSCQLEFN
ncbi:unnamed protein product [Durusdinium trenchii]|uniref:Uncharacterized protein n=1 Tax=Durusdinium trenchii TaxID=1381693 RepID=A0ABP0LN68_9DINO